MPRGEVVFDLVTTLALPAGFQNATLEDLVPFYQELAERPLDDIEAWLTDWSNLEDLFAEAATEASVAYDNDTADPDKEAADLRFSSEISPQLEPWRVRLAQRLVESGYTRPELETTIRRFANGIDLFREENVPLVAEAQRLSSRFSKIQGGLLSEWEGELVPPSRIRPHAGSADRSVRERAFRAFFRPFVEARDALADIFDELYDLRQAMARNAGFENYRDYVHRAKNRFDYSPEDTMRFHDSVELTVVPVVERIYERRARLMGVDRIRPWDAIDSHLANPDVLGRPQLQPFKDEEDLKARTLAVFERVDPALAGYFRRLVETGMLDLMSRPGKAPGGYCTTFPIRATPYIFMNSSGVPGDIMTLLHEAGHAFHAFRTLESQPLTWQRHYEMEMAEVASMSMELLGAPFMERALGGFYNEADAARARVDHLEEVLVVLAHVACVDAFQHWIYTNPGGRDRDQRDAQWLLIRERFQRGIDWSGCEAERVARWYEQVHFFTYPFYYIEYGIAQVGAMQVWRNSLTDPAGAVAAYLRALSLGGSRPLPDLYAAAGASLTFEAGPMGELVGLVEEEIDRLA